MKELYRSWSGCLPARIEQLSRAGSNRTYYRMCADIEKEDAEVHSETPPSGESSKRPPSTLNAQPPSNSVIGVVGTSAEENHAFVAIARHFAAKGLPVPHVLAVSDDGMRYIQTDLGITSLYDAIAKGRRLGGKYDEKEKALLVRTIRMLPELQVRGGEGMDWSVCYPQPAFDETSVMFDLNYFKYCFLKPSGVDFNELRLEESFRSLCRELVSVEAKDRGDSGVNAELFLYRDFQARNVMLVDGAPYFIDFQGGRRGPYYYDVASFLWQASARYPQRLRDDLVAEYYDVLAALIEVPSRDSFYRRLRLFVLFRTLQVLGAYGYCGYFERKKYFIESIPAAIDNLSETLVAYDDCPFPYLRDVLQRLIGRQHASESSIKATRNGLISRDLKVCIYSFSYKRGIPEDASGNGGGYVFDCRSTHNPGRYEAYKQLTGLDDAVIQFLEADGEILVFLESVYKLADKHVERYLERGFTHLMFSFGCTGGQHRSVYAAQHLAEHIHRKYGIEVVVCHREQGKTFTLERLA